MPRAMPKWKRDAIAEQERWIAEHGATLAGYVERYGPVACAKCPAGAPAPECSLCDGTGTVMFGNGGPAIYAADVAALEELRAGTTRRYKNAHGVR